MCRRGTEPINIWCKYVSFFRDRSKSVLLRYILDLSPTMYIRMSIMCNLGILWNQKPPQYVCRASLFSLLTFSDLVYSLIYSILISYQKVIARTTQQLYFLLSLWSNNLQNVQPDASICHIYGPKQIIICIWNRSFCPLW
jgi:hypothetical protein